MISSHYFAPIRTMEIGLRPISDQKYFGSKSSKRKSDHKIGTKLDCNTLEFVSWCVCILKKYPAALNEFSQYGARVVEVIKNNRF